LGYVCEGHFHGRLAHGTATEREIPTLNVGSQWAGDLDGITEEKEHARIHVQVPFFLKECVLLLPPSVNNRL
jgi:hypothetical protein